VNSAVGRADGLTEEELRNAAAGSGQWSDREQAALRYAEAMALGNTVAEELFEEVRRRFGEEEIIELTAAIAWEICAAKFNRALEIEGQGICFIS